MKQYLVASAALGVLALAAPGIVHAQSADEFELNEYRIESDDCFGCGPTNIQTAEDLQRVLSDTSATLDARSASGDYDDFSAVGSAGGDPSADPQVVFLNFDAGGEPTFPVCIDTDGDGTAETLFTGTPFLDHVYTQAERDEIQARIEADYADFNFSFTQTAPLSGDFTTIQIGDNDDPLDCSAGSNITVTSTGGVSVLFGQADGIDFLNTNMADNAFADASFWEFLAQLGGAGLFGTFSGIDVAGDFGGDLAAAVSFAVVNQTSNTGAHEAGHILGLRHQNSFGAPGDGLPDTGAISPFDFVPIFDGPSNASETVLHTMASGASVGLGFEGSTMTDRFFSERSAVRLAVNETPFIKTEDEIRFEGVDRINLRSLAVPNTIIEGRNAGAEFLVETVVVQGDIDNLGETDSYFFRGRAGEFFNAELLPVIALGQTFAEGILGQLNVFLVNPDGSEELVASNARSFESLFDTEIFDAVLPVTGLYRVEVAAPDVVFLDLDGGVGGLDPIPLSAVGGAELLTGAYTLLAFTATKVLDDADGPSDPVAALNFLENFNLIVFEDLSTSVNVDGNVFVGGDLVGPSATFGSGFNGGTDGDVLTVAGNISGGPKNINNGGNVRFGGEVTTNLNLNGGGEAIFDPTISTAAAENVLRALSLDLADLEPNSRVRLPRGRHGPAKLIARPDANGVAVFDIADGNKLLSNDLVQQIQLRPRGAKTIVINLGGKNIDFDRGNLVGAFNGRGVTSRIIWNFPDATRIDIERGLAGTVLAPEAVLTNRSNLTGPVIVADIQAGGTIRRNDFSGRGLLDALED